MEQNIILGLGDNIDYEVVWDSKVLEDLIELHDIRSSELSCDVVIEDERSLAVSILGFLQSESGGERFVTSPEIIEGFARKLDYKITLGGTPVRAAIAMRKLGYKSSVHLVTTNEHVRRLLPPDCERVCSNGCDSSYPHLIVQFGKGTKVKAGDINICTGRANRIIYDNDYDNIVMELHPSLADFAAKADVFLISGFNTMQSEDLLRQRLGELREIMKALPSTAVVFYEDGCFCNSAFNRIVIGAIAKSVNIYSLNEDELQAYLGRKLDLLDEHCMKGALEEIKAQIPAPLLVIHTRYWALAYGKGARSAKDALEGGISMATTRLCYGDDFTASDYERTKGMKNSPEGEALSIALNELLGESVCCLPCKQAEETGATTIGLGDAFVGGFLPMVCQI